MSASAIKSKTKQQHEKVERLLREKLFSPTLEPTDYYLLLRSFLLAYEVFENNISKFNLTNDLLFNRSKLSYLEKDLKNLTVDFFISDIPSQNSDDIEVQSLEEALGVFYVTEGATLGGKIILENLKRYPWMKTEKYASFFNSYGSKRGQMWSEFNQIVEDYFKTNSNKSDEYIIGANKAFNHIYNIIIKN